MSLSDNIFTSDDGYHPEEKVLLVSDVKKTAERLKARIISGNYSHFLINVINEEFGDAILGADD